MSFWKKLLEILSRKSAQISLSYYLFKNERKDDKEYVFSSYFGKKSKYISSIPTQHCLG